jgi:succinate dehydrogenase (ubiquinone) membrane anchor subunit
MSKLLFADSAGSNFQRLYGKSHVALAGLVPASLAAPAGSAPAKVADVGLALAIPLHSHVGLNYVVSDYVPRALQLPVRVGVAGVTGVMVLGLLKLSLAGPGVGGTIKRLWRRPEAAAPAPAPAAA